MYLDADGGGYTNKPKTSELLHVRACVRARSFICHDLHETSSDTNQNERERERGGGRSEGGGEYQKWTVQMGRHQNVGLHSDGPLRYDAD